MSPSPQKLRFNATRETVRVDWAQWDPWAGWQGLIGVAIPLFLGLALHQASSGAIAAGGALYIGVGSYDKQTRNPTSSLFLGCLLMSLAAFLGSLAGNSLPWMVGLSAFWAFGTGFLSILGPPLSFIGIKTLVTLLIASGYPATLEEAIHRAALVLAGSLLQTLIFHLETYLWSRLGAPRRATGPAAQWKHSWPKLKDSFSFRSQPFQHALRLALCVALAQAVCRSFLNHNAYWLPLTTAIVLRPDFDQTLVRGFSRMAGTVIGAGLTTLIVLWLQPTGIALALLTLPCAWACFSLFKANYALYSVAITAYIVFMLSFVGLPESSVLFNRLAATLAGGTLALTVYALWPKETR
jgi:uncharacterized membrane protein YccC